MVKEIDSASLLDKVVKRRDLLALAGQGGLGLVLAAACAGAATPTPTPTAAPRPTPTATPKPVKDTLTLVNSAIVPAIDPHVASAGAYSIIRNCYECPVASDFADFKFVNQLATNVVSEADGNLLLKLREGVKFHSGDDFTADDLKFSVERIADPKTAAWRFNNFNQTVIKRVDVVDRSTVRLVVNEPPKADLYGNLNRLWIMQRRWTDANTKDYIAKNANGTGPYKLIRYEPESVVEMEAFDQWWGGKPGFRKLVMRFNQQEASRLASLQRGEADIMYDLTPDLAQVAEAAGLQVLSVSSMAPGLITLYNLSENNPMDPTQPNPLRDIRVRQACNYAIDREKIIKFLLKGHGYPLRAWIPSPDMRGYVPPQELTQWDYNPDKAKQLLSEAGFPKGFKNKIVVPVARYAKGEEIAHAVADQLNAVGIQTVVDAQPYTIWIDNYAKKRNEPMNVDMGWPAPIDPWQLPNGILFHRVSWFKDAEMEQAFKGSFKLTIEEQDAALRRLNKLAWEKVPAIWLWNPAILWAVSPQVSWKASGFTSETDFYTAKPR